MMDSEHIWRSICDETSLLLESEPLLEHFLERCVLRYGSLPEMLSARLAAKLHSDDLPFDVMLDLMQSALLTDTALVHAVIADLQAVLARDPAIKYYSTPLLYLKGFHALQTYRVAHHLWHMRRTQLAIYLQNKAAEVFAVDVHPAAQIGQGILFDHATGIVIGETTVIADDVSLLQDVTLGGTGKERGLRHPIIDEGVMIGAGAKVLGHINVGVGAKIGAGSVVLRDVPAHTTVAGVPARVINQPKTRKPALDMDQSL